MYHNANINLSQICTLVQAYFELCVFTLMRAIESYMNMELLFQLLSKLQTP